MATLSAEEDNYVRCSLLMTRIAPRALRVLFAKHFPPKSLDSTLAHNKATLQDLKRNRVINAHQWDKLFPPYGVSQPDADITLMVCLLRNLSVLSHPVLGFDMLPMSSDLSEGADVARIKHYRNMLAHASNKCIDSFSFITLWADVSGAIGRLGDQSMLQECDNLRTTFLDNLNIDMRVELRNATSDLCDMKWEIESLKTKMETYKDPYLLIPTSVRSGVKTANSIEIHWEPLKSTSMNDLRGYKIMWREKGEDDKRTVTVSLDTRCYTIINLLPWTKYQILIQAYSDRENLPSCEMNIKTQEAVPSMPPQNIGFSKRTHSIDVFWNPPPKPTRNGYIIEYTVYYETEDGEQKTKTSNICRAVLENLQPSTNYKVSIDCQTAVGKGPASVQQDVRTSDVIQNIGTKIEFHAPLVQGTGIRNVNMSFNFTNTQQGNIRTTAVPQYRMESTDTGAFTITESQHRIVNPDTGTEVITGTQLRIENLDTNTDMLTDIQPRTESPDTGMDMITEMQPIIESPHTGTDTITETQPRVESPNRGMDTISETQPRVESPDTGTDTITETQPIVESPDTGTDKKTETQPRVESQDTGTDKTETQPIVESPDTGTHIKTETQPIVESPYTDTDKKTETQPIVESPDTGTDKKTETQPIVESPDTITKR